MSMSMTHRLDKDGWPIAPPRPTSGAIDPRRRTRAVSASHGLSLVECLVAMVVMCIGALGVGKLQWQMLARSGLARQRVEASNLALQKIEQLRAVPYPKNQAVSSSGSDSPAFAGNTSYARRWTTTDSADGQPWSTVTVHVTWTERTGQPQSVSLTTIAARVDPADIVLLALQQASLARQQRELAAARNPAVPLLAAAYDNGTSALAVPGGVRIYDNISGLVIRLCPNRTTPTAPSSPQCKPYDDMLSPATGTVSNQ